MIARAFRAYYCTPKYVTYRYISTLLEFDTADDGLNWWFNNESIDFARLYGVILL